jgi:TfoX/Sxy family transcriptional regulator of competence genes
MPLDENLLELVRRALLRTPDVEEKRMFGGIAFMVRGNMCVCVGGKGLMCRIDPEAQDEALEQEGCRPMVMRDKPMRGFLRVDSEVVSSSRELGYWMRLVLDYNRKLPVSAAKRKQPTARPRSRVSNSEKSSRPR